MHRTLIVTLVAMSSAACASAPATPTSPAQPAVQAVIERPGARPGDVVAFAPMISLSLERTQRETRLQPGPIDATSGVRISRLTYRSEIMGRMVDASALIAVPATDAPLKGVVLYLRGSDVPRSAAPTNPNAIPITQASVFAGNGYAVVMPDYLGFGASPSPQAFLLTRENVTDFRAALAASHDVLGVPTGMPLFVMGFSQGAQLTAALVREADVRPIEDFVLRGAVAVAGPHELVESLKRRLMPPLSSDPTAIGYVAWAAYTYSWRTGRPLEESFKPAFAERVPHWFGGNMELPQILGELPATVHDLFQPAFLQALESDDPSFWFIRMLRENETYGFTPSVPLRVILGEADDHVDPVSTRILFEQAKANGGRVGLISLPGLDHHQTGVAAYASTLAWFDALAAGADVAP